MIERFTLRVPPDCVAALTDELQRIKFSMPGVEHPVTLDQGEAARIAALAAEMLAPQAQVNWGADRVPFDAKGGA